MQVTFCLLDADYFLEDDKPVVTLWGVDKNGKTILVEDRKFRPYFYVKTHEGMNLDEIKDLRASLTGLDLEGRSPEKAEIVKKTLLGKSERFIKVTVTRPPDVPGFRKLAKEMSDVRNTYEYAISFYKRYLIDKKLRPMNWVQVKGTVNTKSSLSADLTLKADRIKQTKKQKLPKLRTLAFDIETVQKDDQEKIIMISLRDNNKLDKVLTLKKTKGAEKLSGEREMIERFMEIVNEADPHIICAYNSDRFDFLKLNERAEKLGLVLKLGKDDRPILFRRRGRINAARITGRVHVDLFDFVENVLSQTLTSEVLTLNRVSGEITGKNKRKIKQKEIKEIWETGKNFKKLVKYCRHDSRLTMELAEHILPQIFEICRITGQTAFDITRMSYSQLVEWLLIRRASRIGEIVYSRPTYRELRARKMTPAYEGAYVHPPKEGIHDKIALFDFMSLYPTIIVSHNISPETMDCKDKSCQKNKAPGTKHCFCTKKKGFIPAILEELIEHRKKTKRKVRRAKGKEKTRLESQQFALKILANAVYGYYGYAGSRWYSKVAATCITAWGREYIKKVIRMAKKQNLEVLYGDTDSLFLKIKNRKSAKVFLKKANKTLPGIMELELKDIYKRGIFIEAKTGMAAKKKYALLDRKGNLMIRGMETRRRNWSGIAKDTQQKVLKAVLKDKSPEKAVKEVHRIIKDLKKGDVEMDDLVIYTQIKKSLSEYKHIDPHVKAAKKSMLRGRTVKRGSVVAYVITKGKGSISDRAEPVEDAENYDPEYYIHHQVVPSAIRVLSCVGVKEEDLLEADREVRRLTGFFSKSKRAKTRKK